MPDTTVDIQALYAALDGKRQARRLSWRDVAQELGISPSTFTRLAQQRRPDVDTFASLVKWLAVPAESFMRSSDESADAPEPMSVISTYLRSSKHLSSEHAEALEDIIQAAYKHLGRQA